MSKEGRLNYVDDMIPVIGVEDTETISLIRDGSIEICPSCLCLSTYAWEDVDEEKGINHIPSSSCWEWQCGHCLTTWCDHDSPILAECYTHIPAEGRV